MEENLKLSKHERRLAKHLAKKQMLEKVSRKRDKAAQGDKVLKIAIAAVAAVAIAFVAFNWFFSLGSAPSIQITPGQLNLGNVSQRAGIKTASFSLANAGKSDLVLTGMVTSCMCTSAVLLFDGTESPRFDMHTSNSGWSQAIKPGETAELKVYYDPNVHPELRGAVTRTISISSNDPLFAIKTVSIVANQVD